MKSILRLSLILAMLNSCSKMNDALDMPDKMDGMSAKMDGMKEKMGSLERLTKVSESVKALKDEKNYKILSPIPSDLIPWAKIAAENMLVDDELVPFIYINMKQISTSRFDDNNPGLAYDDPAAIKFEMNKVGLFNGLAAVCGFLPEEKVTAILNRLSTSEEYSKTALAILAMRYYFIQNVLMAEKYKEAELVDMGAIEEAIKYNLSLERINTLNFVDEIKTAVNIFVAIPEYNDALSLVVDKDASNKNWKSIHSGMLKYFKVGTYANNKQDQQSANIRFEKSLKLVEEKLK